MSEGRCNQTLSVNLEPKRLDVPTTLETPNPTAAINPAQASRRPTASCSSIRSIRVFSFSLPPRARPIWGSRSLGLRVQVMHIHTYMGYIYIYTHTHTLRARRGYAKVTLGPKYILRCYMEPFGLHAGHCPCPPRPSTR